MTPQETLAHKTIQELLECLAQEKTKERKKAFSALAATIKANEGYSFPDVEEIRRSFQALSRVEAELCKTYDASRALHILFKT